MSKLTGIELLLRMGVLLVVVGAIMTIVPLMTWVERRGMAIMQDRMGPNRVGPFGILQPLADGVKFMFKESIVLPNVDRSLYFLAPVLAMIPALVAFSVIPFGGDLHIGSYVIPLQVSNAQAGILILLAIGSLGVYGTLVAGWSSNNKFAVLGALRAASQMISYEAVMGLSLVSILLIYGTTELSSIVQMQSSGWEGPVPKWGLFMQPVSALLFLVTIFAETNRLPFDLPEGESELVAGYHTEYGGLKFASFMLAEYIHMITLSALVVTLFLGGYHLAWLEGIVQGSLSENVLTFVLPLTQVFIFCAKVFLMLCFFIWIRFTLPRFRYDQLMTLGWTFLLPIAILNLLVTAMVLYWLTNG